MDNWVFTIDGNKNADILVAKITDGKNKGKIIWLSKDQKDDSILAQDKIEYLMNFINEKRYRINQSKVNDLIENVKNDEEPMDRLSKQIYCEFNHEYKKNNEVKTNDELIALPKNNAEGTRDCLFICGCSGSGKSTWIGKYAENFNKMNPKSEIIFISAKDIKDDGAYDHVKNIKQLDLSDEEMIESIVDSGKAYEQFSSKNYQTLVIFDDAEGLPKDIEKHIQKIMENLLFIGRSSKINIIISRHVLNNGKSTKPMFSECNKIVLFPNGLSLYSIDYTLKRYLGFDKYQTKKLCNLKSRWVQIQTHMPRYVLYQRGCYLL